jgi:hypothetical protein
MKHPKKTQRAQQKCEAQFELVDFNIDNCVLFHFPGDSALPKSRIGVFEM